MKLLIDIGNTRLKWARLQAGRLSRVGAMELAGLAPESLERVFGANRAFERVIVSSVADEEINFAVTMAARHAGAPMAEFVETSRRACGVTVAYHEPWRLGVDRFLALIAAHARVAGPACIVSVGTAMTIDLLDGDGGHQGGAIIPAPELMVASLLHGTSGIRERARGGVAGRGRSLFARSTKAALEQGARLAAAATVERAAREARGLLGRSPKLILTGGGARHLQPLIDVASTLSVDLVLQGLAVWAAKG